MKHLPAIGLGIASLAILVLGYLLFTAKAEVAFLMELARLESANVTAYEAAFGAPMYTADGDSYAETLHPELSAMLEGQIRPGQRAYFFGTDTIPIRFLVVVCEADGRAVWRTWESM
jgi:hypothetical protein